MSEEVVWSLAIVAFSVTGAVGLALAVRLLVDELRGRRGEQA